MFGLLPSSSTPTAQEASNNISTPVETKIQIESLSIHNGASESMLNVLASSKRVVMSSFVGGAQTSWLKGLTRREGLVPP
jgi:hypothetical protein